MKVRKFGQPVRLVALVAMLFMLFGMMGPLFQSAGAQNNGLKIDGQLCFKLDTTAPFLVLSEVELSALAAPPYKASTAEIAQVKTYCQEHPSKFQNPGGQKVFVCKFVGTPGVNETLQTGQNPISVSVSSIPNYQGVGSFFADGQNRSLVIAEDNRTGGGQMGEPSAEDCLKALVTPTPPVTPTEVVKTPTEVVKTPTEVVKTPVVKTPTEVVKTPGKVAEAPKPAAPVTGLPSTGTGSDQSAEIAFAVAGVAALAVIAFGIRKRSEA